MKTPKRPYEMVMEIGSDSLEAMAHSLENIVFDIHCMIERGHSNPHITTSGSPDSGYNFSLVRTDTADHDEYFKQLEIFLDERKKEKEAQQVIQPYNGYCNPETGEPFQYTPLQVK